MTENEQKTWITVLYCVCQLFDQDTRIAINRPKDDYVFLEVWQKPMSGEEGVIASNPIVNGNIDVAARHCVHDLFELGDIDLDMIVTAAQQSQH